MKKKVVKKKKWNGFAIAGFVLSFFGGLSVLGFIFCIVALMQLRYEVNVRGKGLAIAGLIISILSIAVTVIQIIYFM